MAVARSAASAAWPVRRMRQAARRASKLAHWRARPRGWCVGALGLSAVVSQRSVGRSQGRVAAARHCRWRALIWQNIEWGVVYLIYGRWRIRQEHAPPALALLRRVLS